MSSASILFATAAVVFFTAPAAQALGFGPQANSTTLGQPLNFAAAVHLGSAESLTSECVAAEVVSGENRVAPALVRVSLEPGRAPDQRSVHVTTLTPIDEPVVTINVSVGCSSRVSRRFVAFLDPPLLDLPRSGEPDTRALPPQRTESAAAHEVAAVRAGSVDPAPYGVAPRATSAARATARSGDVGRSSLSPSMAATGTDQHDRQAERRVARRSQRTPHRATSGPRLQLEAAAPRLLASAAAPVNASNTAPATASSTAPATATDAARANASSAIVQAVPLPPASASAALATERLAQEYERIRSMEASIERLRGDAEATQRKQAVLQARLQQAEAERESSRLVWPLAALSLLLAAIAALGWRGALRRRKGRWWDEPVLPALAPTLAADAAATASHAPGASRGLGDDDLTHDDPPWAYQRPAALMGGEPDAIGGLEVTTVLAPTLAEAGMQDRSRLDGAAAGAVARGSPIEDLTDLEQQVEFLTVLGQDDAAVDLLTRHLSEHTDAGPLPYLELLEIHRRRGAVAAHEQMRAAYHERFGAAAPWDADRQHRRALEDHAAAIADLQRLWPLPSDALLRLEAMLLQPGSIETFELETGRELLLLYSIACELADDVAAADTGIDLLLPLERGGYDMPVLHLVASTGLVDAVPDADAANALDLDLSALPIEGSSGAPTLLVASLGRAPSPFGSRS